MSESNGFIEDRYEGVNRLPAKWRMPLTVPDSLVEQAQAEGWDEKACCYHRGPLTAAVANAIKNAVYLNVEDDRLIVQINVPDAVEGLLTDLAAEDDD